MRNIMFAIALVSFCGFARGQVQPVEIEVATPDDVRDAAKSVKTEMRNIQKSLAAKVDENGSRAEARIGKAEDAIHDVREGVKTANAETLATIEAGQRATVRLVFVILAAVLVPATAISAYAIARKRRERTASDAVSIVHPTPDATDQARPTAVDMLDDPTSDEVRSYAERTGKNPVPFTLHLEREGETFICFAEVRPNLYHLVRIEGSGKAVPWDRRRQLAAEMFNRRRENVVTISA